MRKTGYLSFTVVLMDLMFFPSWAESQQQVYFDKSVVLIRVAKQGWNYDQPWQQESMRQGVGSGFIIEGNRILTNAHNVSDHRYIEIKKQNQAQRYIARVVFAGHDCDLAILEVMNPGFYDDMQPLDLGGIPLANSTVLTVGFPMGGQDLSVTKGVVSRIQMDFYSHSGADSHLVIQTDAAINPGNSGGPVIQDDKVVGVAFQGLRQGDNIGYMIPATVIRHFLADVADGRYDGFGSLGLSTFTGLHSDSYRRYLKVPDQQQGVVVIDTLLGSSARELFEKGDVLVNIDGYDIDNDGNVKIHGLTLDMGEVVEQRQIGEKYPVTFYRDGSKQTVEVDVALNRGVLNYSREYDDPPRYVTYAGLVFMPITRNLLETWGSSWPTDLPPHLRYLLRYANQFEVDARRTEFVIMATILPDELNAYISDYDSGLVTKINDNEVHDLKDIHQALETAQGEYIQITFAGHDLPLVLPVEQARQRQPLIKEKYHLPDTSRLQ